VSARIPLGRDQIAEQMKVISNQRKLIADLEAQGQSARPERGLLRELLSTFEGTLAALRQKSDDVASNGHMGEAVSESKTAVLTKYPLSLGNCRTDKIEAKIEAS
jgi:hypothetical protein